MTENKEDGNTEKFAQSFMVRLAREEGVLVAEKAHEIATRSTESSCQMNMFQEDNYMDEDKDQFRIFILA